MTHKEEDPALGDDRWVELGTTHRRLCAANSDDGRDWKKGVLQESPIQTLEPAKFSNTTLKTTEGDAAETPTKNNRPPTEAHHVLNTQSEFKGRNKTRKKHKPSIEEKRLRWENALKNLEQRQRARRSTGAPQEGISKTTCATILTQDSEQNEQQQSKTFDVSTSPHQVKDNPTFQAAMITGQTKDDRHQAGLHDEDTSTSTEKLEGRQNNVKLRRECDYIVILAFLTLLISLWLAC